MDIEVGQILSQMVAFLIMLWILKKFAWKPILKLLDDRTNKIQGAFDLIDSQKKEVEGLIAEYKAKIREVRDTANDKYQQQEAKGYQAALDIENEAREKAKEIINKAQKEAEHEVFLAKNQLKKELVDMIIASTEKVMQRELKDEAKQKVQIEEFLEKAEIK